MTDSTQPPDNAGWGGQPTPPPPAGGYQPPTYQPPEYGQVPPYGQQGYGPQGYGPAPTNGVAIAALVVGILALLTFFTIIGGIVLGLAAIVLGVLGISRANRLNGTGKGLAIGGLVTGLIGGLLAVLIVGGLMAAFDGVDINEGSINIDGTEFEFPTE